VNRTVTTVPDALCDAVTLRDAEPPALDVATLVAVPATRAADNSRDKTRANMNNNTTRATRRRDRLFSFAATTDRDKSMIQVSTSRPLPKITPWPR
jgi:hypothetical protein